MFFPDVGLAPLLLALQALGTLDARLSPRVTGSTPSHPYCDTYAPAERRAHQCMAEQVSARCTLCTPAPVSTRARQAMVEAPHYAARSDSVSPAFRPSSSNVHPDAHRRKPCNAGPRLGRALTPPTQTLRTPQCTPPVTDRPGPEHTASPAAACARPAPHSPAPKTMPCF